MTVIVSVKINDGIVMASDSASTFANGQVYLNADKIVNLVKGLPIGAMVTGDGGIGNESISTIFKDLRARLDGTAGHPWAINRGAYTMQEIAARVQDILVNEKVAAWPQHNVQMRVRLCGYSANRPLPEIWQLTIDGQKPAVAALNRGENDGGPNWDGEYEPLNRLFLGLGLSFRDAAKKAGFDVDAKQESQIISGLVQPMWTTAMPIQDAIDLARFMVDTTASYVRFRLDQQPKTVGGPIEIATITKHEGFKWVQRKHFYPTALNPPIPAV
jgi:hypothetical protein